MSIYLNEIYQETLKNTMNYLPDKNSSFLITGATGLIGSFIVDVFHFANEHGHRHKVYVVGRSFDKLKSRFDYPDDLIECVQQDVCNPITGIQKVGYVVHAASNADPKSYAAYPAETLLTNIEGTKNVLDYCRLNGSKMLLTSTFEVYGKKNGLDIYTEEDFGNIDINAIRSCYPESKRSAEILLRCYVQQYGVKGYIARLCSVYGPTMLPSDNKAHAQFIHKGICKENVVLKSRGEQRRTYMYVADAVSAIFTIMNNGKIGEAYNISNEKSVATIAEVASEVASIAGTKVIYELPDANESRGYSRPQNCILDNCKLRALGWSGKYNLHDGLYETMEILDTKTSHTPKVC